MPTHHRIIACTVSSAKGASHCVSAGLKRKPKEPRAALMGQQSPRTKRAAPSTSQWIGPGVRGRNCEGNGMPWVPEMGIRTSNSARERVMTGEAIGTGGEPDVVLTGEGRAFSAGGDLEWLMERSKTAPKENEKIMMDFYSRFLLPLRTIPVPTIAALNGPVKYILH